MLYYLYKEDTCLIKQRELKSTWKHHLGKWGAKRHRKVLLVIDKDVIDKAVHDGHGPAGDTRVRVNLLEDFVDVDAVVCVMYLIK